MEEMRIQGNTGKWKKMWLIVQNNIAPQIHYAGSHMLAVHEQTCQSEDGVVSACKLLSV